ncbi:HEPN domain-containing protein [Magnetospirillum aberrantis]|uniref:RiboL-PSP-HEPN domain-containing protein n=1 Tax=Magnetospirillum aberrantis SpK TaxID=908842 RepID=A0A7C9QRM2_9PROT|nr:HEPN domain-containing protein [Magnetospirillum aberrantis]NFV78885.1 hypothetical protein [Magnetospirillum aberrantis SpK]
MRFAIESRVKKLDSFFSRAGANSVDDEIRADMAKFGAILICGFVERSVEIIVLERLSGRAHPRITKFIQSYFKKGTNYSCEQIKQLLEKFDVNWSRNFKVFMDENGMVVDQLDSAYTLRNSVAHGGEQNRGLAGVRELYLAAKVVVDGVVSSTV